MTINVNKILLVLLLVIFLAQIYFFLAMGSTLSDADAFLSFVATLYFIPRLLILGILGSILSVILLIRRKFILFSVAGLLISLTTMTPYTSVPLADAIAPTLKPMHDLLREKRQQEHDAQYRSLQEADYHQLISLLQLPQEVAAVHNNLLLLKNGMVAKLFLTDSFSSAEFEKYVTDTLITTHKPVLVRLPSYYDFTNRAYYAPRFHEQYFADKATGSYGDIPALVFIDGKLLNISYKDIAYPSWLNNSDELKQFEQQGPHKQYEQRGPQ